MKSRNDPNLVPRVHLGPGDGRAALRMVAPLLSSRLVSAVDAHLGDVGSMVHADSVKRKFTLDTRQMFL